MINLLLIVLVVIDLILIAALFLSKKDQSVSSEILSEISQEKRAIKELSESLKADIQMQTAEANGLFKKINAIAAESDILLNNCKSELNADVKKSLDAYLDRFEENQIEVQMIFKKLQGLKNKITSENELLKTNIKKAEKLSRFFENKVPYEELLEDIEDKKYVDARHLLAKGYSDKKVASEVGLPINEVQLIAKMG